MVDPKLKRKNQVELIGFKAWLLASGFEMSSMRTTISYCMAFNGNGLFIDLSIGVTQHAAANREWFVSVSEKTTSILDNPRHYLENASPYDASAFLECYLVEREILNSLPCV